MRTTLFTSAVVAIFSLASFNSVSQLMVPNGDFELWTGSDPDQWFTPNLLVTSVTEVPGTPGSAARAESIFSALAQQVIPGSLVYLGDGSFELAIDQNYAYFHFDYQLSVSNGDGLIVAVDLMDDADNSVGSVVLAIAANASSWTHSSTMISYTGTATKATVGFYLGDMESGDTDAGNFFQLDNVHFSNSATTVGEPQMADVNAEVFPNPACGDAQINVMLDQASDVDLILTSIDGRKIYVSSFPGLPAGKNLIGLPTDQFESGQYILTINAAGNQLVKRLDVLH